MDETAPVLSVDPTPWNREGEVVACLQSLSRDEPRSTGGGRPGRRRPARPTPAPVPPSLLRLPLLRPPLVLCAQLVPPPAPEPRVRSIRSNSQAVTAQIEKGESALIEIKLIPGWMNSFYVRYVNYFTNGWTYLCRCYVLRNLCEMLQKKRFIMIGSWMVAARILCLK
jgi:hypothetical protein